jgi:hypothetical protein
VREPALAALLDPCLFGDSSLSTHVYPRPAFRGMSLTDVKGYKRQSGVSSMCKVAQFDFAKVRVLLHQLRRRPPRFGPAGGQLGLAGDNFAREMGSPRRVRQEPRAHELA